MGDYRGHDAAQELGSAQGIATETDRDHGQGQEGEDSEDPPAPALELAALFLLRGEQSPHRGRTSAQIVPRRRGYCTLSVAASVVTGPSPLGPGAECCLMPAATCPLWRSKEGPEPRSPVRWESKRGTRRVAAHSMTKRP